MGDVSRIDAEGEEECRATGPEGHKRRATMLGTCKAGASRKSLTRSVHPPIHPHSSTPRRTKHPGPGGHGPLGMDTWAPHVSKVHAAADGRYLGWGRFSGTRKLRHGSEIEASGVGPGARLGRLAGNLVMIRDRADGCYGARVPGSFEKEKYSNTEFRLERHWPKLLNKVGQY